MKEGIFVKFAFFKRFSLLFDGLLACVLVLVIESISRHSLISAFQFSFGAPLTFLYNALLIFVTLLILYFFKRRMFVRFIICIFWLVLGIINGCVLANRVTPFNFTDLKLVGDLFAMDNSKYLSTAEEAAIIIALGCLAVFLVFIALRGPKYQGKIHRLRNAAFIAVLVLALPAITRAAIQSNILAGYFGNLAEGYQEYGFVYCFAASAVDTGMSKPDNYSEETITAILDSVETEETSADTDDLPNIIFVQLETFIDPYELNFLEYSEDPIPNFHNLMENYTSGYLTVPVVGAGTANTEFEVLTGMGIQFFGLGEYPYKTVLKETVCESIADDLSQLGYGTHAIHNNSGNFYSRATVFSQMGFDSFTSEELMNITEYNEYGTWPTDSILVGETQKALDSTEDQSDFVFTITVQSHGSYPTEEVFEDPEIEVTGGETEEEHYQWEYYINELHEVDAFIGDLIAMLEERDEKTIVVLYGDHLPTMGLADEDMNNGSIYQTTYATWNNFGLEEADADLAAYQLMAYITDQLDIHEGTLFTYHQSAMSAGTTGDASYVTDWELLQYDLLYGELYSYGGEQKYEASDLVMGVEDVVIEAAEISGDGEEIVITGENFTPSSVVYINGEAVETEYVSGNELLASVSGSGEGEISVVVNQVGSSETVFRSSNEVSVSVSAP
ncbi:MAG: sulfatase-like hydrolase/transferase [Clostridiales bacterium]|nr:sulfatase-like hydrolase/transferase [Clostridiales bacterium]